MDSNIEKLNIGCGKDIKKEFINLDIVDLEGVDVCHDLNKFPYPFNKENFKFIFAKDILEHLQDVQGFLAEIYRVLKPGGKILIKVPHFSSDVAFTDVQHKNFFGYYSLDFFIKSEKSNLHEGGGIFFSKLKKKIVFGKRYNLFNYLIEPFANKFPFFYEGTALRNFFPALRVEYILVK